MYRCTSFTREELACMLGGEEIIIEDFDGIEHRYNLYTPEKEDAAGGCE